jgi:hypothetical protein
LTLKRQLPSALVTDSVLALVQEPLRVKGFCGIGAVRFVGTNPVSFGHSHEPIRSISAGIPVDTARSFTPHGFLPRTFENQGLCEYALRSAAVRSQSDACGKSDGCSLLSAGLGVGSVANRLWFAIRPYALAVPLRGGVICGAITRHLPRLARALCWGVRPVRCRNQYRPARRQLGDVGARNISEPPRVLKREPRVWNGHLQVTR